MIEIFLPGKTIPKGRPRVTFKGKRVITYTPPRTRDYEEKARAVAISTCNKEGFEPIPFPTPVKMTVEFILPRHKSKKAKSMRPDIINLASTIADLFQGGRNRSPILYEDDSQIVELHVFKSYGDTPMTRVVVEELKIGKEGS
jgi:Holliday junction resolvase RusA-like endonuclease